MAKLIITADDSYVEKLKKHLEKEHPSTKGKMSVVLNKPKGRPSFNKALKDQIRVVTDSGKKVLNSVKDPLRKMDDDLKKALGEYY